MATAAAASVAVSRSFVESTVGCVILRIFMEWQMAASWKYIVSGHVEVRVRAHSTPQQQRWAIVLGMSRAQHNQFMLNPKWNARTKN